MAKNEDKNKSKGDGKGDKNKDKNKNKNELADLEANNNKTSGARAIEQYTQSVLGESLAAGKGAGKFPGESDYTKAYYAGIPTLYQYGDKEQAQALNRSGRLYGDYRSAGKYNKTDFGDIEAGYGAAGEYTPAELDALKAAYGEAGQYDPSQFSRSDYRTQNIQERMSPYEQLVADRQRARLKRTYDEARGERELQAARAGAFGGSGAAIQEELARRNYAEQLADLDAQSLQSGYEAAVQLYGKEVADRMAAETAEEQSRQFGKEAQFRGLAGQTEAEQMEEQSRQFGKGAEFEGLGGQLASRQQTAAQEAAAKEAEFMSLAGMSDSARLQAALAEQQKNLQIANLGAMQSAGAQKEQFKLNKKLFPLDVASRQAAILGGMRGAYSPLESQRTPGASTAQNILSGVSLGTGLLQAAGGLGGIANGVSTIGSWLGGGGRDGGLVPKNLRRYNGGGLADLQPQYYSKYER